MANPSIPTRLRAHEYPHVRSIDTQALDALLRIEELLSALVAVSAPLVTPDLSVSQRASKEDIEEARKPYGVINTTKRKNSRQL